MECSEKEKEKEGNPRMVIAKIKMESCEKGSIFSMENGGNGFVLKHGFLLKGFREKIPQGLRKFISNFRRCKSVETGKEFGGEPAKKWGRWREEEEEEI